ncbi:hypothetical protein NM688_g3526 [Phlebia brevispora]|uniref:Uncharacterized protein n=1 Tax=Phlebia brevispora TaxID=194682 RepID=A0ACC1T655_9APHY|nr:hypothetical protein NM688_g3526 [Phlebia brevispora]
MCHDREAGRVASTASSWLLVFVPTMLHLWVLRLVLLLPGLDDTLALHIRRYLDGQATKVVCGPAEDRVAIGTSTIADGHGSRPCSTPSTVLPARVNELQQTHSGIDTSSSSATGTRRKGKVNPASDFPQVFFPPAPRRVLDEVRAKSNTPKSSRGMVTGDGLVKSTLAWDYSESFHRRNIDIPLKDLDIARPAQRQDRQTAVDQANCSSNLFATGPLAGTYFVGPPSPSPDNTPDISSVSTDDGFPSSPTSGRDETDGNWEGSYTQMQFKFPSSTGYPGLDHSQYYGSGDELSDDDDSPCYVVAELIRCQQELDAVRRWQRPLSSPEPHSSHEASPPPGLEYFLGTASWSDESTFPSPVATDLPLQPPLPGDGTSLLSFVCNRAHLAACAGVPTATDESDVESGWDISAPVILNPSGSGPVPYQLQGSDSSAGSSVSGGSTSDNSTSGASDEVESYLLSGSVTDDTSPVEGSVEERNQWKWPTEFGAPVYQELDCFGQRSSSVRLLGFGAYGCVFLSQCDGHDVAIKVIRKPHTYDLTPGQNGGRGREYLLKELALWKKITESGRPFLVHLLCAWDDGDSVYFSMRPHNQTLETRLTQGPPLEAEEVRIYAAELVSGVSSLHAMGIMHRDIKPANILINSEGHLALADFGLSHNPDLPRKVLDFYRGHAWTQSGTPGYWAPEVRVWWGRPCHPEKLDRWTAEALKQHPYLRSRVNFGALERGLYPSIYRPPFAFPASTMEILVPDVPVTDAQKGMYEALVKIDRDEQLYEYSSPGYLRHFILNGWSTPTLKL